MRQSSRWVRADGLSLVELVIAVALLGIISAAALQFLTMTETTMFGEQSRLTKQQKSEAVSAYIYEKFRSANLPTRLSNGSMRTATCRRICAPGPASRL